MFFIFGSPRSGTTLLSQCLSAHPSIVVPDETDFIIPTAFICDRIKDGAMRRALLKQMIPNTARFTNSLGEFLSAGEVEALVDAHADEPSLLIEKIYDAIAAKAGVQMAGDKSPNDLLFLRMLVKIGGISDNPRIIHIVRDVRDVLSSLIEARLTDQPERWFPDLWNSSNLYLNSLYKESDRYRLIRYEDLVRDPEREMAALCAHLGVNFDRAMLDTGKRHDRYREEAHHAKLYNQINTSSIATYKSTLSEAIIARCEASAAAALRAFNYSTSVQTSGASS